MEQSHNIPVCDLDIITGTYLKAIQDADNGFTGRAVKVHAMNFELLDDGMESLELCLFKDCDAKKAMVSDLRVPVAADMLLQEINRCVDNEFREVDNSGAAAIYGMVHDFVRPAEAKKRYLRGKR
jgi:hypothetical protein